MTTGIFLISDVKIGVLSPLLMINQHGLESEPFHCSVHYIPIVKWFRLD